MFHDAVVSTGTGLMVVRVHAEVSARIGWVVWAIIFFHFLHRDIAAVGVAEIVIMKIINRARAAALKDTTSKEEEKGRVIDTCNVLKQI